MLRPSFSVLALVATAASAQASVPANAQAALKKADDGIARILAIPAALRTFENAVRALVELGSVS